MVAPETGLSLDSHNNNTTQSSLLCTLVNFERFQLLRRCMFPSTIIQFLPNIFGWGLKVEQIFKWAAIVRLKSLFEQNFDGSKKEDKSYWSMVRALKVHVK